MRVEMVMKRLAIFSAVLILSAAAALAQSGPPPTRFSNQLLNDVARMTKAGMPDATILAYVKTRRAGIDSLSADDLIQLRRAGGGSMTLSGRPGIGSANWGPGGKATGTLMSVKTSADKWPVPPKDHLNASGEKVRALSEHLQPITRGRKP